MAKLAQGDPWGLPPITHDHDKYVVRLLRPEPSAVCHARFLPATVLWALTCLLMWDRHCLLL